MNLKKLVKKFKQARRKEIELNPQSVVRNLKKLRAELTDAIWAYTQIDAKFKLPEPFRSQSIDFAKKAEFGVSSFHDTLTLGYEQLAMEARAKQIKPSEGIDVIEAQQV